jgi:thiamine transport system permease protein
VSRGRRYVVLAVAAAAVPLAVLAVFFVVPVVGMLRLGFLADGELDLGGVLETLVRPRVGAVVWFTLWSASVATAVTVALGVPVAYALHRLSFPGQRLLRGLVAVPFVLPTVVVGVAFRTLLGDAGPLGFLGLDGSAVGIVAALVFFNVSVVVRTVGPWWEAMDSRREEAAAALGATPYQVLRTVTLPALRPVVLSAASVVFLFCATAFGVVLTMGGLRYATVETEIYLLTTQFLDLRAAAALSVLQIVVVVALLVLTGRARPSSVERVARRAAAPGAPTFPPSPPWASSCSSSSRRSRPSSRGRCGWAAAGRRPTTARSATQRRRPPWWCRSAPPSRTPSGSPLTPP